MHLVFLNQYYPPDAAPTGVMLAGVVGGLVRAGHEVTVLCAAGGYAGGGAVGGWQLAVDGDDESGHCAPTPPPTANRQPPTHPRIIRIRATRFGRGTFAGKLLDYVSYYGGVSWKLLTLRPAPQRIVALTTPPYLSVLARLISKFRGADHAHWVMDLYPDVLAAHGMLDERGLVYRMLAGLARWGFGGKRCVALLTLGPDMAERVGKRVGSGRWAGKTQDNKTQDARPEVERNPNIQHRTPNIERQTEEDCGEEPKHGVQTPTANSQPPTLPPPPPLVQWVPLWGTDGAEVGSGPLADGSDDDGRADRPRSADVSPAGRAVNDPAASSHPPGESRPSEAAWPYPLTADRQPPTANRPARALRHARGWNDDDLVVMYSGNMGLGHRFEEILDAAREVGKRVGSGRSAGKTQDNKTQDARPEEERNPNIQHRTPNIERRTDEDCDGRADRPRSADVSPAGRAVNDPALSSSPHGISRPSEAAWPYPHSVQTPPPTAHRPLPIPPPPSLRFAFFGGGKRREEVARFVRENPACGVELHDYAAADELTAHLQSADVHLASLEPAWTGTMVPSKVQGIFGAGRPVIFIGSAQSSIGQWVLESGGGWVVAPGDVAGLLDALAEASDPATRTTRGCAAKAFAGEHFQQDRNVARVTEILTRAVAARRGGGFQPPCPH